MARKRKITALVIVSWIIILALLLTAIILGLDYYQRSKGRPSLITSLFRKPPSKPPIDQVSREIEAVVCETLEGLNFPQKDILTSCCQIKEKGQLSWFYFTKRLTIPKGLSLSSCEKAIGEAVLKKTEGKILERELDKETLSLKIGYSSDYPTHLLIIKGLPLAVARVAIIIDDFGQNFGERERALLNLGYPLTLAVLPKLPYSERVSNEAHRKGLEVILHLPMEPHGYPGPGKNPGKPAIFTDMSDLEIARVVKESIKSIPYLSGVNNHMGSRATESQRIMSVVLDEIKRTNLFFVDSLTSQNSVGYYLARKKGLRAGKRNIFLDNRDDKEYINAQLRLLAREAKKNGYAIAIGHVQRKWTSVALAQMLPRLEEEGIRIVPASEVVD